MPKATTITEPKIDVVTSTIPEIGVFGVYYHGASLLEPVGFRGVSHLCEHLLTKAIDDVQEKVTERGLETNAWTSDTSVALFAKGLTRNLDWYIEEVLLRDGDRHIHRFTPTEEEFNTERNVVLQEYEGTLSQPFSTVFDNICRKHYSYYRPVGLDSDLRNLTYAQFLDFFNERFRQPTGIYYAGKPQGRSWEKSDAWSLGRPATLLLTADNLLTPKLNQDYEPQSFGTFSREVLIDDWLHMDTSPRDRDIMGELWNAGGTKAPLMQVLRDTHGLCYGAYLCFGSGCTSVVRFYITTAPENVDKARDLAHSVVRDWCKYLTRERFDSVIGRMRCDLEHKSYTNHSTGAVRRHSEPVHSEADLAYVNAFTYERAVELSEQLAELTFNIAQAGETLIV